MKKTTLVLATLVLLLFVIACTPTAPAPQIVERVVTATPPAVAGAPTAAAAGQALAKPYRIGMVSDLVTTNIWARYGPTANTVYQNYVMGPTGVAVYNLNDKRFDVIPQVAADLDAKRVKEGDKTTTTVKLKKGVKWSNGKDVTAKDVAFTANTAIDLQLPGTIATVYDRSYLEKVDAVDDYTVKYIWSKPPGLAKFEYGAAQGRIINAEYWTPVVAEAKKKLDGVDKNNKDAYAKALADAAQVLYNHAPQNEPVAGGFSFVKWEKGAFWENKSNPGWFFSGIKVNITDKGGYTETKQGYDYKQGDTSGNKIVDYVYGPTVTGAVFSVYGTQDAAVLALKKGDIDYWEHSLGLPPGIAGQLKNETDINVISNPTNGFRYLAFNTRKKPMGDKEFRQAMAILIDKEFVSGTILQNVAFPLYTEVPKGNAFWYNPKVTELGKGLSREERLNQAIALLEKAGYKWEGGNKPTWDKAALVVKPGGKLLMPDGTPMPQLTLIAPSAGYDPLRSTFAIWVERFANEVGIPVKAELIGFNDLVARVNSDPDRDKKLDMYILGWSLNVFPSFLETFHHSRFGVKLGDTNAGGYSNPEYDKLSEQLGDCQTYEECQKIAFRCQEILSEELPYVVLFDTGIFEAYRTNLKYPYTETLSGLQFLQGLSSQVSVIK